tara:strand:- start:654 stop:839 length:186 start_codon:yes stop_codon:yes gene_type:complete
MDKLKEYRQNYYQKNKKKISEYQRKYYLRKKGLPEDYILKWRGEKIYGATITWGYFKLTFD